MQISVKVEMKDAVRQLRRAGERNIPMAVAQSLTATAVHLRKVQHRVMPKYLDRPTKFTQSAFLFQKANWRDFKTGRIKSRVYAKDIQEGYLKYMVSGGRRLPKRRAIVVPGKNTRLNKYGNLTRTYVQTQLARDDTYVATINGVGGLWKRTKAGRLKMLVLFTDDANYRAGRYPFFRISERVVRRELPKQIKLAVRRAARARSRK